MGKTRRKIVGKPSTSMTRLKAFDSPFPRGTQQTLRRKIWKIRPSLFVRRSIFRAYARDEPTVLVFGSTAISITFGCAYMLVLLILSCAVPMTVMDIAFFTKRPTAPCALAIGDAAISSAAMISPMIPREMSTKQRRAALAHRLPAERAIFGREGTAFGGEESGLGETSSYPEAFVLVDFDGSFESAELGVGGAHHLGRFLLRLIVGDFHEIGGSTQQRECSAHDENRVSF